MQTTVGNNGHVATISALSLTKCLAMASSNIVDSVAPTFLLPECLASLDQQPLAGLIRDRLFVMYQMNLWGALTLTNLVALYCLFFLRPRSSGAARDSRWSFWLVFVALVSVLGIAVHGPKTERWGLAGICLQPLVFLTLAWLGSVLGNARYLAKALWIGATVVESGGMLALHFYVQTRVLVEAGRTAAGLVQFDPDAGVSSYTQANWRLKITNQVTFLGDTLGSAASVVWIALAILLTVLVVKCWRARSPVNRVVLVARA
jgi:hypothetical protein